MDVDENSSEPILAALLTLDATQFSDLTGALAADSLFQIQRLSSLLISPSLFISTLRYIESLSLHRKTLLIARLLLRSLRKITQSLTDSSSASLLGTLRDYDAGLLLLTFCQLSDSDRWKLNLAPDWRATAIDHVVGETMRFQSLGFEAWAVVGRYVDTAMKCRRFVAAVSGDGGVLSGKRIRAGASAATVVSLGVPRDGRGSGDWECVICRESLGRRWEACELPCSHVFHWRCIGRWLRKDNTCPCCRHEMPSDDVFCEIERLWRLILAKSRLNLKGDCGTKVD